MPGDLDPEPGDGEADPHLVEADLGLDVGAAGKEQVDDIESVMHFADGNTGKLSVGGMKTKLESVKEKLKS